MTEAGLQEGRHQNREIVRVSFSLRKAAPH